VNDMEPKSGQPRRIAPTFYATQVKTLNFDNLQNCGVAKIPKPTSVSASPYKGISFLPVCYNQAKGEQLHEDKRCNGRNLSDRI
jgi:hypothetical protein